MSYDLSIIIPSYNHLNFLEVNLPIINSYFNNLNNFSFEIIIVNDGSTDATSNFDCNKFVNCRILNNKVNRGKGYSVRRAFLEAKGGFVLVTDTDLATPIKEFSKLFEYRKSNDIIIGSRSVKSSKVNNEFFYRQITGYVFSRIVKVLFNLRVKDSQCGFKLFNRKKIISLTRKCKINGFAFDVELLYLARKNNFKIKEVGVEWNSKPDSRVLIWKHPILMFIDLLKIKYNYFRGKYD